GRSVRRNAFLRLRPRSCVKTVCVNDATDFRKLAIKKQMGFGVGTGFEFSFNDLAIGQGHHSHMRGLHAIIRHAAGLDDHQPALEMNAGDIAPRLNHQASRHEVEVGFANFAFEFFEHENYFNSRTTTDLAGSVAVNWLLAI